MRLTSNKRALKIGRSADRVLSLLINRNAVISLLSSRIMIGVNWYNIGSVYSLIALNYGENIGGLGVLTGIFYAGLALGQVPAGIISARIGPRKTAIYGATIASLACFLAGMSSAFYQIIVLRLVAGLGLALAFAPGITLMAKYFQNQ